MDILLKFKLNDHLYLRDPESGTVGKLIVHNAIELICESGFDQLTFKKIAQRMDSTEATVYRYFSSKYQLLAYMLNWYWSYLEFTAKMRLQSLTDPAQKLRSLLQILTRQDAAAPLVQGYDPEKLHRIAIAESSKASLLKEADELNRERVFAPLKSLCDFISQVIREVQPSFEYPQSLASTLLAAAHDQQFFSEYLPALTDQNRKEDPKQYVFHYLNRLAFTTLK